MSSQNELAQPGTEVVPLQHQRSLDSAESSVRLDGTVAVPNSSFETSAPPATQLDVREPNEPEDHVYPTGPKLYLAVGALYTAFFLNGLDLTIVAVAVPSLTNYFHSIDDIGWYSVAYSYRSL